MALETAAGPISLIAERLGLTLAQCAAWQALTGGVIHYNQLPPPSGGIEHSADELTALRPFALIWTTDTGYSATRDTSSRGIGKQHEGELIIRLERNTPAGQSPAEAERSWENIIGKIIGSGDAGNPGLIELAGDPRYLPIETVSLIEHGRTARDHVRSIGDAQRAFVLVRWTT